MRESSSEAQPDRKAHQTSGKTIDLLTDMPQATSNDSCYQTRFGKGFLTFGAASIGQLLALAISNVLALQWVAPEEAGIWSTLTIVHAYLSILQMGVFSGLAREYPFLIGAGREAVARTLCRAANGYAVGGSFAIALGFVSFGLFGTFQRSEWMMPICVAGATISLAYYQQYLMVVFRSSQDFAALGRIFALRAIWLIGSLVLVKKWGFSGYCFRYLLDAVLMTALLHCMRPVRAPPVWDRKQLGILMKTGVFIAGSGFALTASESLLRIYVLATLGVKSVGMLTPGLGIYTAFGSLATILNSYFSPRMAADVGAGRYHGAWRSCASAVAVGLVAQVGVAVLTVPALPSIFLKVFPSYLDGVAAAQWLAGAAAFSSITAGTGILVALKEWRSLAAFSAVAFVLRGSVPLLFLSERSALADITCGWMVANFVLFCFGAILLKRLARRGATV